MSATTRLRALRSRVSAPIGLVGIILTGVAGLAVPIPAATTSASWQVPNTLGQPAGSRGEQITAPVPAAVGRRVYLPIIARARTGTTACAPISGESYGDLSINDDPTDRPAEAHADLNLGLRGYVPSSAYCGLVDYTGSSDSRAPQLPGLFGDGRTPAFLNVYRVYDWNWDCNCRGNPITQWDVTLAGLGVAPGEPIHVPDSGYDIGSGYEVLVLYASQNRITLKYTRDDNVVHGYTIHVENVCVEPRLLALYQSWNSRGREHLPALRAGQAFGRALGTEIGLAIRDDGSFLDPRSRKDWWKGRQAARPTVIQK